MHGKLRLQLKGIAQQAVCRDATGTRVPFIPGLPNRTAESTVIPKASSTIFTSDKYHNPGKAECHLNLL